MALTKYLTMALTKFLTIALTRFLLNPRLNSGVPLRGGSDSDQSVKQIPAHNYPLHIAYLHWRKYRKLNDPIPLNIREAVILIKPQIADDRKLIRSFVQKRLTEYTLKVVTLNSILCNKFSSIHVNQFFIIQFSTVSA